MSIKLKGSSDGSVSFDAPADTSPSGSDITLVLPTTVGSAEQFLKNSGTAGTLEFSSMVETSTGVGIGTSSPSGLLHLAASSEPSLYFEDTGSSNTLSRVYKSGSSLTFNSRHTSAGQFVFNSENSGGTVTERMRINSSGNVGINETSPSARLHISAAYNETGLKVLGGAAGYSSPLIVGNASGTEYMRIDDDGRMGIGTSSPTSNRQLTLNGNDAGLQISGSGPAGANTYITLTPGSSAAAYVGTTNSRNLNFVTNGNTSSRMTIDGSGNVGIGTTSPDGKLHVHSGSAGSVTANGNANNLVVENSDTGGISILTPDNGFGYIMWGSPTSNEGAILRYRDSDNIFSIGTEDANGILQFRTGAGTERMRLDTSGYLALGTTSPSSYVGGGNNFVIASSGDAGLTIATGTSATGTINFADGTSGDARYRGRLEYSHSLDALDFLTAASTRMRIDSSGRLLVNTTSPSNGASYGNIVLEFAGNSFNGIKTRDTDNTGTVTHMVFVSGSSAVGSITGTTGAVSFNNLSDYRKKENDVEITDGIEKVKLLRPIRFNYISDPSTVCDGFFAHEVTPAVPTAVTGAKDAVDSEGEIDPQMLDASKLVPLLTAALQEAIAKIETLETKVAALEAQ